MSLRGSFIPETHGTRLEALMDVIRFGPELLKGSEFLALLFHVERSLAYGKNADSSSLRQMVSGIGNRKTGQRIRGSAGISKAAAARANLALEKLGLIERRLQQRENGACAATEYQVIWQKLVEFFVKEISPQSSRACLRLRQANVPKRDKGPAPNVDSPPVSNWDTNRVDSKQSSSSSEKIQTESSARQPAISVTTGLGAALKNPCEAKRLPDIPLEGIERSSSQSFQSAVDDELAGREKYADPEGEFRARLYQRHPMLDVDDILRTVRSDLSKGNVNLTHFLALDRKRTTNPSRLENPAGYYRTLAMAVARESLSERLSSFAAVSPPAAQLRCPQCRNLGFVGEMGNWCDCALGKDLRLVEGRSQSRLGNPEGR